MGKFIGIAEILQGGTPNRPTHSTPEEGKKGEALARTSLEYPLELHRIVLREAVDIMQEWKNKPDKIEY